MRGDARKRAVEPRQIVGLIGKKRAGKDTFAAALIEHHGFVRYAFADPLKEAALGLDPLVKIEQDETSIYSVGHAGRPWHEPGVERLSRIVEAIGWEAAKEIREVRGTLQRLGVAIREVDRDFWIRTSLDKALRETRPVVITDVRFPNEADAIHSLGGTLIRIVRPGQESTDTHVSETALDGYPDDLTVLNSGAVAMLTETAKELTF